MNLIHCSYHKCLTVYYSRVMQALFNRLRNTTSGYQHFNSLVDDFYASFRNYRVTSINNHALDLSRLGDFRITRFIRDPRDLVVSGYFYHKRGAEAWCNIIDPTEADFKIVNGVIPDGMKHGESYTSYLNSLSQEDGLIAEIDFRASHFTSMRQWPQGDTRVKLFRYEDILANEVDVFASILRFYGVSWYDKALGFLLARRHSARNRISRTGHIRNPNPGQWNNLFTNKVTKHFVRKYTDILERYGYQ